MPNLFIAYDLMSPGQTYERVEKAVKELGVACKLLNTTWYVKSAYTMEQSRDHVAKALDQNDKLLVIDANNACGTRMPDACWKIVTAQWNA